VLDAQLALKGAQADYKNMQATLQSALMDKKAAAAAVNSDYTQDVLQAQTDQQLKELGVISGVAANASKNKADQLTTQHQISQQQIEVNTKAIEVQLASSQTKIDQAKALLGLYEKQEAALQVRAGINGVLVALPVPLQVGQHVTAGTSVAEVVQLDQLKASQRRSIPTTAFLPEKSAELIRRY
jgi:HlyD family secretion protein